MKADLIHRLQKLEHQIAPSVQSVVVYANYGETDEELNERVERWKAGEPGTGVQCGPNGQDSYKGNDLCVYRVISVKPGDIDGTHWSPDE